MTDFEKIKQILFKSGFVENESVFCWGTTINITKEMKVAYPNITMEMQTEFEFDENGNLVEINQYT